MLLSGAGDALGYRNQQWEYNESGAAIHKELEELGGLKNIKAELPDWPVSDDTLLHLATAEGLATGKEGEELLHEVAARYVEGMKDMEGRKPGPSSIHGVSQLRPGEEGGYLVAYNPGCGAAMRSMCIGLSAFLGMTVHWIDRLSLKRKKATLACRELKVGQTHQLLGEAIHEVHREFGIVEKVVVTTTDNGANYVAASNAFGESEERGEVQEEEEKEEEEEVTGQPSDVQGQLDDEPQITLPPHRCCSAHTLNLMATTDIREVKGWSKGDTPWRRASTKARRLWNLQNRSPTAANQIKEAVKTKLTTPVAVRWNSYLNSVKVMLEVMSLPEQVKAINNIIIQHKAGVAIPTCTPSSRRRYI